MAIKKSLLESKWYYRTIKTFLLLLPLFVVLYIYGVGYVNLQQAESVVSEGGITLGQIVLSAVLYYIVLKIVWRLILYIGFGGLEDDMKKKREVPVQGAAAAPVVSAVATQGVDATEIVEKYVAQQQKHTGEVILWIIFILCIVAIAIYGNSNSSYVPGARNPSPKCVSTGCGTSWRCNGSYYDSNGTKRSINGCYSSNRQVTTLPSWSGTCRQCP